MKKKHNELKRKKGREEPGHENKRASVLITKSSSKIPAMGQRLGRPAISLGQSETGFLDDTDKWQEGQARRRGME